MPATFLPTSESWRMASSPLQSREPSNPGISLDRDWLRSPSPSHEAVGRRLEETWMSLPSKVDEPEFLKLLQAIDLTSLRADDTPPVIRSLCRRARQPLDRVSGPSARNGNGGEADQRSRPGAGEGPGYPPGVVPPRVASVCVHFPFLPVALEVLEGSGVPVGTVAGAFPHGLTPLSARRMEVRASVDGGAEEVDVVIRRDLALTDQWDDIYDEVSRFREDAGGATLKVILATGELRELGRVARATRVAMMAGADFVKTSTGTEEVNATYPAGLVILDEIRRYRERTGWPVGFKAAGGIRTTEAARQWLHLVETVLGPDRNGPESFRIGASSLLDDLLDSWPDRGD